MEEGSEELSELKTELTNTHPILKPFKEAALCTDILIRTSETEPDPEMRQRQLKDAHEAKDKLIAGIEECGIGWRISLVHGMQAMGLYLWEDDKKESCVAQAIFEITGHWFD